MLFQGRRCLFRGKYIELVGVMDEDFFVYYEDVEWSLRRATFGWVTPTTRLCAISPARRRDRAA